MIRIVFNTIFVSIHICTQRTQLIVGSMNIWNMIDIPISDTARNRTHNLFRSKYAPIPRRDSDGTNQHNSQILLYICSLRGNVNIPHSRDGPLYGTLKVPVASTPRKRGEVSDDLSIGWFACSIGKKRNRRRPVSSQSKYNNWIELFILQQQHKKLYIDSANKMQKEISKVHNKL